MKGAIMTTIRKNPRIVKALIREIDGTIQKYGRQTIREVVQDLVVRNILRSPHPTDDQVLRVIYQTGVLRMSVEPKMAEMHSVLERYTRGQLGLCTRCRGRIEASLLEQLPSSTLCRSCRKSEGVR